MTAQAQRRDGFQEFWVLDSNVLLYVWLPNLDSLHYASMCACHDGKPMQDNGTRVAVCRTSGPWQKLSDHHTCLRPAVDGLPEVAALEIGVSPLVGDEDEPPDDEQELCSSNNGIDVHGRCWRMEMLRRPLARLYKRGHTMSARLARFQTLVSQRLLSLQSSVFEARTDAVR